MKGNNHYMWKGFAGVSCCLSLSACCEREGTLTPWCWVLLSTCLPTFLIWSKNKGEICQTILLRYHYVIISILNNTSLLCKPSPLLNQNFCKWKLYIFIFVSYCVAVFSASPLFSYSCLLANVAFSLCSFCWLWSAFAFAGVSEFLTASRECVFWKSYSTFGATIIGTKPLRSCRRVCGFTHSGLQKYCAISFF